MKNQSPSQVAFPQAEVYINIQSHSCKHKTLQEFNKHSLNDRCNKTLMYITDN